MTERKEYTKPELKQVKLVAEEAVLTNCKSLDTGIGGPGLQPCVQPLAQCFDEGS